MLVATLAVDDQGAIVDLDVDVLRYIDAGQFNAYDRVIAVLDDLRGGAERPVVRGGGAEEIVDPAVEIPSRTSPNGEIAHCFSSVWLTGPLPAFYQVKLESTTLKF